MIDIVPEIRLLFSACSHNVLTLLYNEHILASAMSTGFLPQILSLLLFFSVFFFLLFLSISLKKAPRFSFPQLKSVNQSALLTF